MQDKLKPGQVWYNIAFDRICITVDSVLGGRTRFAVSVMGGLRMVDWDYYCSDQMVYIGDLDE